MAYMRGDYYVYGSENDDGVDVMVIQDKEYTMCMPSETFDALVMMRVAEMTEKERIDAGKRAIENHSGNFGCSPLREKAGLISCFDAMKHVFKDWKKEEQKEIGK